MIPTSYRVQDVSKRCSLCEHAYRVSGQTYCMLGEKPIMILFMEHVGNHKLFTDMLERRIVNMFGVCDEFTREME